MRVRVCVLGVFRLASVRVVYKKHGSAANVSNSEQLSEQLAAQRKVRCTWATVCLLVLGRFGCHVLHKRIRFSPLRLRHTHMSMCT